MKIIAIKINNNSFFIVSHIDSKYYNNYSNQIINLKQLFHELVGYSLNNVLCLDNIIQVKDLNNNIIEHNELYELFNSIIIMNRLSDEKIYFVCT